MLQTTKTNKIGGPGDIVEIDESYIVWNGPIRPEMQSNFFDRGLEISQNFVFLLFIPPLKLIFTISSSSDTTGEGRCVRLGSLVECQELRVILYIFFYTKNLYSIL